MVTKYAIPSLVGGVPAGIVSASDGNLWVAAASGRPSGGEIVKVSTGGQMTEYRAQSASAITTGGENSLFFAVQHLMRSRSRAR